MSGNVVSLTGSDIENDRRALFVAAVSASFDLYVKDYDEEPECIMYVMGGLKQTCRCAWSVNGESSGGPTTMQAMASAVFLKEMVNPE